LLRTQIPVFAALIRAGIDAIMMSNATIPGLTTVPATLSSAPVAYLRNTLHFHGMIIDDALSAGAISALHLSVAQAAVRSLAAGDDLIIYGSPSTTSASLAQVHAIATAIVTAVQNGTLQLSTLRAAAALDESERLGALCSASLR
jgi:beta-N-acetylhexosaminidase